MKAKFQSDSILFEKIPLKISVFRDYPKILKQLEFELKLLDQEWSIRNEKSEIDFSASSIATPLNARRKWALRFVHESPEIQVIPKILLNFCFHANIDLWGLAKSTEFLRNNDIYIEFYEEDIILEEEGSKK
jgi:hypothetical protein